MCDHERWVPAIKISELADKTPNPGHKRAWRVYNGRGNATADLLSLEDEDPRAMDQIALRHASDHTKSRILRRDEAQEIEPLLVEILREGRQVYELPSVEEMRAHREADVARLDPGVKRLINPHIYHVSLTEALWKLKQTLIASITGQSV